MFRMQNIARRAREFLQGDSGPTATEYAILLALIVFAIAGSIMGVAQAMQRAFSAASEALTLPG